jgi:HD-GYP domain-containing protein (c-di-GMP phosphodiesterase class II)
MLQKCEKMTDFYKFEHKDKMTFLISASLINFGKLKIQKDLLNKTAKISKSELETIQYNVYYNKTALQAIYGFNHISRWASIHQEKLNGEGYPDSLKSNELSFKDRLISCINVYNSLMQDKPYREKYRHEEAIDIMNIMAANNELDSSLISDIDKLNLL